jgi:hypothetical protein
MSQLRIFPRSCTEEEISDIMHIRSPAKIAMEEENGNGWRDITPPRLRGIPSNTVSPSLTIGNRDMGVMMGMGGGGGFGAPNPNPFMSFVGPGSGPGPSRSSTIDVLDSSIPLFDNLGFISSSSSGSLPSSSASSPNNQLSYNNVLRDDFSSYFNNSFLSDVILFVNPFLSYQDFHALPSLEEKKAHSQLMLYGHRLILSSRSEYFRLMFTNQMREMSSKEILLYEIEDSSVFEFYLKLFYSVTDYEMMGTLLNSQETTTEQNSSSSSSSSGDGGNPSHSAGHSSIIGSLMKLMVVAQRFQSLALLSFLQFYFLKLFIVSVIVNEKKEYSPEERRSLINDMKLFSEEYQLEVLREFFENRDKFVRRYLY